CCPCSVCTSLHTLSLHDALPICDDHADDDGFIDAADTARLQLLDQTRLRLQCLGHHHQAGGVLVQPMHDTSARHVDQVGHVMQQGIEQRAIRMARSRMYHQPCGFVQYQDVFILEDDKIGRAHV